MANAEGRVVVASLLASTEALGIDADPADQLDGPPLRQEALK